MSAFRLAGVAAALSIAALAGAVDTRATTSLAGPGTIRITDKLVEHVHVDEGARGPSAGDVDFYRWLLFTHGPAAHVIGHSDLTCIDTGTGSENCSGTYFLPRGKLMVAGVTASHFFYELAVVGGTSLYANARGAMTATFLTGKARRELLIFRLVI